MDPSYSPFNTNNPYSTSLGTNIGQSAPKVADPPSLCKVMFGFSLGFCCLRLLIVPFSIMGYLKMQAEQQPNPMAGGVQFEVITGACIVLFGIPGNILLLLRKGIGIILGWLLVASVCGSIGVGVWEATTMFGDLQPGTPEFVGAIIGGAFTILFRGTLLGLYVAALLAFAKWHKQR